VERAIYVHAMQTYHNTNSNSNIERIDTENAVYTSRYKYVN